MNDPSLRAVERELSTELARKPSWAPELPRAARVPATDPIFDLSSPPRQSAETYAPPSYRQSDDEIDPVVRGLLTHLPPAESVWPAAERKLWLELLEGTFRMIYREAPTSVLEQHAGAGPAADVG